MSILNQPIPARPKTFSPEGAPPGVALYLDAYETLSDGYHWKAARPSIRPRVGIVHTNAASVESTQSAQVNWGRNTSAGQGRNTTKPHYLVAHPGTFGWLEHAVKVLPTNLRGIANSTGSDIERQFGEVDCSFWTYAIETADTGTNADPGISDFLAVSKHGPVPVPHAELVARIFAYESIVWDHPLDLPEEWNGTGIATHTSPFPFPYYTTKKGKSCPGDKKKATFQREIIPRAQQIREAWLNPSQGGIVVTPAPNSPEVIQFTGVLTVINDPVEGWRPIKDSSEMTDDRSTVDDVGPWRAFIGFVAGKCDDETAAWIMQRWHAAS